MKPKSLEVQTSSLPVTIPAGARVMLSNNGADQVRICRATDNYHECAILATVNGPQVTFHGDDLSTEIELSGYVRTVDNDNHFRHVTFTFAWK